ncbi:MAG: 16S rRNA (cytosine(1402)-N(4))-methyltransferase RsmH [Chthoniobacteraceae bacterium]
MPRTPRPSAPGQPSAYHRSVLPDEVVEHLQPGPGRVFLDGTLGAGGHARGLMAKGARVIALDVDPEAIAFATRQLSEWSDQLTIVRGSFSKAGELLDSVGVAAIDGALLDLGVSSHQLDTPERGFSFQADGPLDMRMDPDGPITAADLVNTMSGEQLERIFREYGEERAARRIAVRITRERLVRPFHTTRELADCVESVVPRRGRIHPATRVFQGLRLAVNRELEALEEGLQQITPLLRPGGRFAVITFHSLEDRIVKRFFKERSQEWLDRPEWPEPHRNPEFIFRAITRKAVVATRDEQLANPRSRSAKLRVVERVTP